MRDLEIRGAGNLLGEEQSGHIAAVGFDLYCQMVTEAVGELNGDRCPTSRSRSPSTSPSTPTCRADYVARDDVRMEAYRRLAAVTDPRTSRTCGPSGRTATARRRPPAEALLDDRPAPGGVRAARHPQPHPARSGPCGSGASSSRSRSRCGCNRFAPGAKVGGEEIMIPWPGDPAAAAAELADAAGGVLPARGARPPPSPAAG